MGERVPYLYSILRLVPRIERGESLNVGLVMFCRPQRFLHIESTIDHKRLQAFASAVDPEQIQARLETLAHIAAGNALGGPVAALDIGERFHWLTNVSNTMIQSGEVHPGLTIDAEATFARLYAQLVAPLQPEP